MSLDAVERWLVDTVIGRDLCPFARAPYRNGAVHITTTESREVDDAVHDALVELQALAESTEAERSTTLIAAPAFLDWSTFREVIGTLEVLLEQNGLDALFQVVGFHPDAVYAGAHANDPANAAARAPVPVIHLLRADELERLAATHPDPAGISARNADLLRQAGSPQGADTP